MGNLTDDCCRLARAGVNPRAIPLHCVTGTCHLRRLKPAKASGKRFSPAMAGQVRDSAVALAPRGAGGRTLLALMLNADAELFYAIECTPTTMLFASDGAMS